MKFLKPKHDQIFFDKFHMSNAFSQIGQKFVIHTIKKHLTHEICHGKFGRRVKEA